MGFFGPLGCVGIDGLGKQKWIKIKAHDPYTTVIINNSCCLFSFHHVSGTVLCILHVLFYFTNNSAVLFIFLPSFYR